MIKHLAALFSLAIIAAFAVPAVAAERMKFDAAALATEQKAGKGIVIHITAPWCPTCTAQKPIVDSLLAKPEYKDVVLFDLDFDSGLSALRALNARSQSTLIVFKGETEVARSAGDTNAASVASLVQKAL